MTPIQFAAKWPRLARLSPAPATRQRRFALSHNPRLPEVIRINKRLSVITIRQAAARHTAINATTTDHAKKGDKPMNLFRKNAITPPSGAFVALILLTALTTSPASHASSAFLSRAIKHGGAPVIEAGLVPSKRIVTLEAFISPGSNYSLHAVSASGDSTDPFVVPSGQNFVITSVEITPFSNNAALAPNYVYLLRQDPLVVYELWLVSNQVSTSFQYPTGIVLESGSTPWVSAQLMCDIFVHGYLTPA